MEKTEKKFVLNGYDYISMNKLMKILRICNGGGEANQLIVEGKVLFNGEVDTRKRKKCRVGDIIETDAYRIVIEA